MQEPPDLPPPFSLSSRHSAGELDIPTEAAPSYELTFEQAYRQWIRADAAFRGLSEREDALSIAERELKLKRDEMKELNEKSAVLFNTLHARKQSNSISSILPFGQRKKNGSNDEQAKALADFDSAHKLELNKAAEVEVLEEKVEGLKRQRDQALSVAAALDDIWQQLRQIAPIPNINGNDLNVLTEAENYLANADGIYAFTQDTTKAFSRACVTIQHAHHYLTQSLKYSDSVRGGGVGHIAVSGIGQMGKMAGYRDAVSMASRAQVCLNEALRVLEPYASPPDDASIDTTSQPSNADSPEESPLKAYFLPAERLKDYNELKELGLMQISKIYNLLYGGKMLAEGTGTSVNLMLNKQERAFAHLTHLAVWVQERAKPCETEERKAQTKREDARRRLAALLWGADGLARTEK